MELREERRGASELQQQFTKAKAAWEMERTELKCHIAQVGAPGTPWTGGAAPCLVGTWGWGLELPRAWWGRGAGGWGCLCCVPSAAVGQGWLAGWHCGHLN